MLSVVVIVAVIVIILHEMKSEEWLLPCSATVFVVGFVNLMIAVAFIKDESSVDARTADKTRLVLSTDSEKQFQVAIDGYQESLGKVLFDVDEYNVVRNPEISEDMYVIEHKITTYPEWWWGYFFIKVPIEEVKVTKHIAINTPVEEPVVQEPVAENTD